MFVIFFLKALMFFLRTFTSRSATALPGLIIERHFPKTLPRLLSQCETVVLVTGTNGKTTTTRMLVHLLKANNIDVVTNSSGSNMLRGIASTLLEHANLFGKIHTKVAVFEVEEATMPKLTKFVSPQLIIVTNIFRDQLDAYGEIDKTLSYIRVAIQNAHAPTLILNGDDERVSSLQEDTTGSVHLIRIDPQYHDTIKFEKQGSSVFSSQKTVAIANITTISEISIDNDLRTNYRIAREGYDAENVTSQVPGIHNTFNATAAILGARNVGTIQGQSITTSAIESFKPVFGRGETVVLNNTRLQIFLVKNPAGMNANLHLLSSAPEREALLLILNDQIADGRDVSWIWDCDFNLLKKLGFTSIYVTGKRKWDMALRIDYEGITVTEVFETEKDAIEKLRGKHQKVFVLPTYTAMMELRETLRSYAEIERIWK